MDFKGNQKHYIGILILVIIGITSFLVPSEFLSLAYLKQNQEFLNQAYIQNKSLFIIFYFLLYVLTTAVSFPGATILTLAGSVIFGFWLTLTLVSFASSIGATIAFLLSRYFFKDYVQRKFPEISQAVNNGINNEGALYLLSMRLMPIFPFFLINLTMGLTNISIPLYYIISQIGMLAGTVLYVNAGVQLSQIQKVSDILSLPIMASLLLLALFPIIVKRFIRRNK